MYVGYLHYLTSFVYVQEGKYAIINVRNESEPSRLDSVSSGDGRHPLNRTGIGPPSLVSRTLYKQSVVVLLVEAK
jgi:hypothetical protein